VEEVELATSHALQEEKITSLSQEKNELLELIATLRKENASLKEIESQFVQLKIELKTAQDRAIQLEADHVRSIEKEKQTSLSVAAARFREEEIKLIRERERLETGISDLQISLQNEKLQASETEKKWQATVQELKSKEADLVRLAAELSNFKVQTEELRRMLGQTQQAASEQQKKLEAIETRSAEEIRIKTEEVLALKQKVEEWIPLRDGLNNRNKELQNQLEGAQKQIREFASVIEQQDLLNKRNRIISQISEKETKLKEFSYRQEVIESDLREAQESLSAISGEREALEKEILSDRQAQKHLLEQLKLKEKTRNSLNDRNHTKSSPSIMPANLDHDSNSH